MSIDLKLVEQVAMQTEEAMAIAEAIAVEARAGYQMHELKTDDPRMGVVAEMVDGVPTVLTRNPFAHLDEYANGNAYNLPSAAMRSAAANHGKFTPAPPP